MLRNETTNQVLAAHIIWCDTFWSRLKGLMFRRTLPSDHVLIFVYRRPSIADTTIHMLFVFFPIAVLWLDEHKRVVDLALARPFCPYYAPHRAAQYFVEGLPHLLEQVTVGDQLAF